MNGQAPPSRVRDRVRFLLERIVWSEPLGPAFRTRVFGLHVCRIPAPTFAEGERAAYISRRLKSCGLQHVETDALHNVSAILAGAGGGPTIMVVAHMDTVFPADADVEPRSDGRYWRAPGIRDNSASVAVVLLLPEMLRHRGLHLAGDLILAFSVGEEGRGDLRGIKALMDRYGSRVSAVVAADGNLGVLPDLGRAAIGTLRPAWRGKYRVRR